MATINREYFSVATALHAALLTSPATKADCAAYMITTGGLTLTQAKVEAAIDLFIADLFSILVLTTANYATLLSRHQAANPAAALSVLRTTGNIVAYERTVIEFQALVDDATAEWAALSTAQKAAIQTVFTVGQDGIAAITEDITQIQTAINTARATRGF